MSTSKPKHRFGLWAMLVVVLLLGFGSLWFFYIRPYQQFQADQYRIRRAILKLSTKCPADVDRDHWANYCHWTDRLQSNCCMPATFDSDHVGDFADELERRLEGPVDMATIDWIWDQYIQYAGNGQYYSDIWRPTDPQRLKELDEAIAAQRKANPNHPNTVNDPLAGQIEFYERNYADKK